ncbi:MAG: hypothetical protein DRJ01_01245 [Bacteroidetes bacterium]|nr:MAG: hypothetical protein DRJ01_01245 [Bacteroidota bacterium]
MKRYLIVLVSLFFFGFANAQNSNLVFFTENGEAFTIFLNGINQNSVPQTNVKITDLNAVNYHIKIVFNDKSLGEIDKNIFFNKGKETTYAIKQNKKGIYTLRFRGEVPIEQAPQTSNNQNVVKYTTTSAPNSTTVTYTETTTSTSNDDSDNKSSVNINISGGDSGVNFNLKVTDPDATTNQDLSKTTTTYSTTTTTTSSSSSNISMNQGSTQKGYVSNYNGKTGCNVPMTQADFLSAKQTIASKDFEDSKLTIAKQITTSNCLLASQVKEIMKVFEYEDSKLEYAKFAYRHTYDIGNYFKVNDAFEYESSIDELDEYINSQR